MTSFARDQTSARRLAKERRQQRNELLAELYRETDGAADRLVTADDVQASAGLLDDEWRSAVTLLESEGAIVRRAAKIALTAAGALRTENLLTVHGAEAFEEARARAMELQSIRLGVLVAIYERAEGDEAARVPGSTLKETDASSSELEKAWGYLRREGLVEGDPQSRVGLTHAGLVEVERALTRPNEPTEHFPSPTIMHFHSAVGAVQAGQGSTATIRQRS